MEKLNHKEPCMCDMCYAARDAEIARVRADLLAKKRKEIEDKFYGANDPKVKDILSILT